MASSTVFGVSGVAATSPSILDVPVSINIVDQGLPELCPAEGNPFGGPRKPGLLGSPPSAKTGAYRSQGMQYVARAVLNDAGAPESEAAHQVVGTLGGPGAPIRAAIDRIAAENNPESTHASVRALDYMYNAG